MVSPSPRRCPDATVQASEDAQRRRVQLKRAVASRKIAAGKARRAKIVLLSNQGHTAREIAERLDCNERTLGAIVPMAGLVAPEKPNAVFPAWAGLQRSRRWSAVAP